MSVFLLGVMLYGIGLVMGFMLGRLEKKHQKCQQTFKKYRYHE